MPYKSDAQRKWAHTPTGMKQLGKKKVTEYDKASKGLVLPVKVNLSMSGLAVNACPVSGPPGTTDNTPSGRPASANTSASALMVSGVSAAGLRTIVHPAISAGPSLLQARNNGTFQATTAPTTPTGSRNTRVCP